MEAVERLRDIRKLIGSWPVVPSPDGGGKHSPLRRRQKFIHWHSRKGGKALTQGVGTGG